MGCIQSLFTGSLDTAFFLTEKTSDQRLAGIGNGNQDLEKMHASQPDPVVFSQLNKLRFELNSILQKKAEFALFLCKQRYYEQGEAAGRFLAQRVQQQYNRT